MKKAIDDRAKRISNLTTSLQYLEGAGVAEVGAQINALGKEKAMLQSQLAELEAAKASDDGRKSDLDKLFQTLDIMQRHNEELTYKGKRKWLEALGFKVRVWATDHAPRWEITSTIDPSFWEIDEVAVVEPDIRDWPEAEAMAGRILLSTTSQWGAGPKLPAAATATAPPVC